MCKKYEYVYGLNDMKIDLMHIIITKLNLKNEKNIFSILIEIK